MLAPEILPQRKQPLERRTRVVIRKPTKVGRNLGHFDSTPRGWQQQGQQRRQGGGTEALDVRRADGSNARERASERLIRLNSNEEVGTAGEQEAVALGAEHKWWAVASRHVRRDLHLLLDDLDSILTVVQQHGIPADVAIILNNDTRGPIELCLVCESAEGDWLANQSKWIDDVNGPKAAALERDKLQALEVTPHERARLSVTHAVA